MVNETPPPSMRSVPLRSAGAPEAGSFRTVVVETALACAPFIAAWEDLAKDSIEPNVFYEPWMLLPAVKSLGPFPGQRFVFLFAPSIQDPKTEVLCGFFPLQTCHTETAVAFTALGLLRHPYCYVRTPLLRARYARECLGAFFDWLASEKHAAGVFELSEVVSEGPFRQLVTDEVYRRGTCTFALRAHTRALFRPGASVDAYLSYALSNRHRRDIGRKARRLSEHGAVTYTTPGVDSTIEGWTERFLKLEASGWKGRSGTALAAGQRGQTFFREVMHGAFERKRLLGLELGVGAEPVAMRVSFAAGSGAMAFKLAFNESFAHYSPGMLLEVENVRRLHATRGITWMDCGAVPDSQLFNRVWIHRRTIETLLLSTGRSKGTLLLSLLPLLRLANRSLVSLGLGRRAAPTESIETDAPSVVAAPSLPAPRAAVLQP